MRAVLNAIFYFRGFSCSGATALRYWVTDARHFVTTALSRNVGHQLPNDAEPHPKRTDTSRVQLRKSKHTQFHFTHHTQRTDARTVELNLHACPAPLTPCMCPATKPVCEGFSAPHKAIRHQGSVVLGHRLQRLLTSGQ
jgi:hypothetical protein